MRRQWLCMDVQVLKNIYYDYIGQYVDVLKLNMRINEFALFTTVCGRTFQETKVSFGSPQHTTIYTPSPGTSIKPFRMVSFYIYI